jgi:hypothetical protein
MTRKPGDPEPESPGGHAADRLREFMEQRLPQTAETGDGERSGEGPPDDAGGDRGKPADPQSGQ